MDLHKFAKKVFFGKRERLDDRSWNNIEALEDISRGRNLPRIDIGDESINERLPPVQVKPSAITDDKKEILTFFVFF